jgi:hypothetical protein
VNDDRTPRHGFPRTEVRRRSSVNAPGFEKIARDLSLRLEKIGTVTARKLAEEGRALEAALSTWSEVPPLDDERRLVIDRVVDFNRQACDLIAGGR